MNSAQELCEAITSGDRSLVEKLLAKDPSLTNSKASQGGDPVLHFAIQNDSPESVELLIAKGADLNAKCLRGRTPIQRAFSFLVGFGYRPGLDKKLDYDKRIKVVEILLDAGAKRDLWIECCMGNLPGVQAIVNSDADSVNRSFNPSDASGGFGMDHYPLTGAVGGQHYEIAAYLLENGADPNTPFFLTGYNHTDHGAPLEIAVRNEDIRMAQLLLDNGASPNTSRHACSNAMQTAIHSGNNEMINLLLRKGGTLGFDGKFDFDWGNGRNILQQAAYLQMDPPPTKGLPLRFVGSAAFNGSPHLMELALSKMDSIPVKMQFALLQSLIKMWSISIGNVKGAKADDYFECMKLLLDFGVDPNARNDQGETCLQCLAKDMPYPKEEHRVEFSKLLLAKGACPN